MAFGMMDFGYGMMGAGALFWLYALVWLVAFIWVLVSVMGRKDVKDGQKVAWILVALLSGLLGALIYYAVSGHGKKKRR